MEKGGHVFRMFVNGGDLYWCWFVVDCVWRLDYGEFFIVMMFGI
jgi:hypothetical protein